MNPIIPAKLQPGDTVRIIAPARSLSIISDELRGYADKYFEEVLGLRLEFSDNSSSVDEFNSSSIQNRIDDLHTAFEDPNVKAILTVIGGNNSNQLLDYINWDIIKQNPKVFCGFSDITVLQNAILAKTGLVTYSGPHYITFGQKIFDEYTADYFKKCLFDSGPFGITASSHWTDDRWYLDQSNRSPVANDGYWLLNEGQAEGTIIGGNLCSVNLLQGTSYMPTAENIILFIEDNDESYDGMFDRDLQSLLHSLPQNSVKGLVIGRFQKESDVTREKLQAIVKTKAHLANVPVIANVDFGHTDPKITFPVGGNAHLVASQSKIDLQITTH